jgi:hypothetical protein
MVMEQEFGLEAIMEETGLAKTTKIASVPPLAPAEPEVRFKVQIEGVLLTPLQVKLVWPPLVMVKDWEAGGGLPT